MMMMMDNMFIRGVGTGGDQRKNNYGDDDDFYIILPSNSNANTYPDNYASSYNVAWEEPIYLDEVDKWKVALTEISYHHTALTVRDGYGLSYWTSEIDRVDYVFNLHVVFEDNQGYPHMTSDKAIENHMLHYKLTYPTPSVTSHHILTVESEFEFEFIFKTLKDAQLFGIDSTIISSKYNEKLEKFILKAPRPMKVPGKDAMTNLVSALKVLMKMKSPPYRKKHETTLNISKHWTNVAYLIAELNSIFSSHKVCKFEVVPVRVTKIIEEVRIKVTFFTNIERVVFLNGLNFVLGIQNRIFDFQYQDRKVVAEHMFQLNRAISHMYVYASICAPIQVGQSRVPLLKSIWMDNNNNFLKDEVRYWSIRNPMYIPINTLSINNIEVNIRTDSGALIPFSDSATTSITLHFKKRRR